METEAAGLPVVHADPHSEAASDATAPLPSIELNSGSLNFTAQALSPESNSSKPHFPRSSLSSRHPSPALSGITTLTSISATPPPPLATGAEHVGPPPAKRRKLTETEKIQKRVEKAEKEHQKVIEKAKRDEEKLRKDEERRVKNEEREEKKRQQELIRQQKELEKQKKNDEKEEKKREKEEEQRRKQEEEDKKARAQSRINAFFAKPTTPAKPKAGPSDIQTDASPLPKDNSAQNDSIADASKVEPTKHATDYEKEFPPLPSAPGTTWAPYNRFSWDDDALQYAEKRVAECLYSKDTSMEPAVPLKQTLDVLMSSTKRRAAPLPSVKNLIVSLQGSALNPIDLTHASTEEREQERTLQKVPLKYVFFSVDVRPPYIGTNTVLRSCEAASRLARNPFSRSHEDLDYDYDSEAEWEEPEEGEDLGSENESVADSADEDDLDGFLDDEDDGQTQKARVPAGALVEPITKGLYWESASKSSSRDGAHDDLRFFKMEIIKDDLELPIDPFTTSYWEEHQHSTTSTKIGAQTAAGQPFRPPLKALSNSLANSGAQTDALSSLGRMKTKGSKKMTGIMTGSELEAFKNAVSGSDLPKVGLLAVLKKQFPKTTNDVIKDTLEAVAARVGAKAADKKWVIVEGGKTA